MPHLENISKSGNLFRLGVTNECISGQMETIYRCEGFPATSGTDIPIIGVDSVTVNPVSFI